MRRIRCINAWLIGAVAYAAAAHADGDNLLFGGADVSGHGSEYGQVGVLAPLPGSSLGNGWGLRATTDALAYQYRAAEEIKAQGAGAAVSLGYMGSGEPGWWSFFTGPSYQYTRLSPDDPSSPARGSVFGWMVQGEGEYFLAQDVKINAAGNYTFADNSAYWTRLRLLARVDGQMFAGPEATYQGDRDYTAWQVGAGLFGIPLSKDTQLGVHAGVRKVQNLSASPYGGVEVGSVF